LKRAILVSYEFPPRASAQALSAAKLAKGLAERGWEIEVVTVLDPPTKLLDGTLLRELPDEVRVNIAYSLEPTRLAQAYSRIAKGFDGREGKAPSGEQGGWQTHESARYYTSLPRWAVQLLKAFFLPDEKIGWMPWAVREGERIHRRRPVDVVIGDGPPYTSNSVGVRLARRLGLPCVAVLMDPVFGCYAFPPPTPMHALFMRRFERKLSAQCNLITIATEAMREDLVARVPEADDRVMVLCNGFDPEDFDKPRHASHDGFVISYVGAFQRSITPEVFLKALRSAAERDPGFGEDVKVRFVGPSYRPLRQTLSTLGLDAIVTETGLVSHEEAISYMRSSDILLLVLGPEPESRSILTTKLPEYLASGRPVLALVPPDGVAAETVRRCSAGEVVRPGDVEGAAQALLALHRRWTTGTLPSPDEKAVSEFSWAVQIDRLDSRMKSLRGGQRLS